MDVRLATFSSDEINRYGYSIGVQALAGALEQAWEGTPMFVSHDYHRLLEGRQGFVRTTAESVLSF